MQKKKEVYLYFLFRNGNENPLLLMSIYVFVYLFCKEKIQCRLPFRIEDREFFLPEKKVVFSLNIYETLYINANTYFSSYVEINFLMK